MPIIWFHFRYDLVKHLKTEVEVCIGELIDDEIELYSESGHEYMSDTETLVARITDKVTKSPQLVYLAFFYTQSVVY